QAQDITVYLDAMGQATITAEDVNNGSGDNCGIASMSVSPNNFSCSNLGTNTITLTVYDGSGNESTDQATVTVIDNTPPVAIGQNLVVELDEFGQVTIDPEDVDNGSYDNCEI